MEINSEKEGDVCLHKWEGQFVPLKSWTEMDNAVNVFLSEAQPDDLSCLSGFKMFTDVLSFWINTTSPLVRQPSLIQ